MSRLLSPLPFLSTGLDNSSDSFIESPPFSHSLFTTLGATTYYASSAGATPPDSLSSRLSSVPTVVPDVGSDPTTFTIHWPLLIHTLTFFSVMLHTRFKEGAEQRIPLPEDDKTIVRCLVQWTYYKSYDKPADP